MATKKYEKRCARLVQEATNAAYQTALRWVREDQAASPAIVPLEVRALRIVEKYGAEEGHDE